MEQKKTSTVVKIVIPVRSLWSFLGLCVAVTFTYFQAIGYLLPGFNEINELKFENIVITQIGLVWIPAISHLLIGLNLCLGINIFKQLKHGKQEGFIFFSVMGFIIEIIFGIFVIIFVIIDWKMVAVITIAAMIVSIFTSVTLGIENEFK